MKLLRPSSCISSPLSLTLYLLSFNLFLNLFLYLLLYLFFLLLFSLSFSVCVYPEPLHCGGEAAEAHEEKTSKIKLFETLNRNKDRKFL